MTFNKLIFHIHPPVFVYRINEHKALPFCLLTAVSFSVHLSLLPFFFSIVGGLDIDVLLLTTMWIFYNVRFCLIPSFLTFSVFFIVLPYLFL
jgi:hypothetical protein